MRDVQGGVLGPRAAALSRIAHRAPPTTAALTPPSHPSHLLWLLDRSALNANVAAGLAALAAGGALGRHGKGLGADLLGKDLLVAAAVGGGSDSRWAGRTNARQQAQQGAQAGIEARACPAFVIPPPPCNPTPAPAMHYT